VAHRPIELKLGGIVVVNRERVLLEGRVESNQGGDDFLGPNDQT
jgi:hypothetical protein